MTEIRKKALIDGDGFVYRAGFSVEKTRYLVECQSDGLGTHVHEFHHTDSAKSAKGVAEACDGTIWSRKEIGTLDEAVRTLDSWLNEAIRVAGAKDYGLYLSPGVGNFRDKLGTIRKYKGNREDNPRPVYYLELREHVCRKYTTLVGHQEEADDTVSWMARYLKANNLPYVVIGQDKDLRQIPGQHFNWVAGEAGWFDVSEDEAQIFFWTQVLSGDTGDNIVGCWGVGEKGARNIVLNAPTLREEDVWPIIVEEYRKSQKVQGCPYKDLDPAVVALEMARLVRLKRFAYENLWVPKQKLQELITLPEAREADSGPKKESEPVQKESSFAKLAGAEEPSTC